MEVQGLRGVYVKVACMLYVRKLENGEPNGFLVIFDWPMHQHGHWPGRFTGEPMNARPHLEHATVL